MRKFRYLINFNMSLNGNHKGCVTTLCIINKKIYSYNKIDKILTDHLKVEYKGMKVENVFINDFKLI